MTERIPDAAAAECRDDRAASASSSISRSAVSTAASTSETIISNESVHTYEDWELGFDDNDDDNDKALSLSSQDGESDLESSSTASSSPASPRNSARSMYNAVEPASANADSDDSDDDRRNQSDTRGSDNGIDAREVIDYSDNDHVDKFDDHSNNDVVGSSGKDTKDDAKYSEDARVVECVNGTGSSDSNQLRAAATADVPEFVESAEIATTPRETTEPIGECCVSDDDIEAAGISVQCTSSRSSRESDAWPSELDADAALLTSEALASPLHADDVDQHGVTAHTRLDTEAEPQNDEVVDCDTALLRSGDARYDASQSTTSASASAYTARAPTDSSDQPTELEPRPVHQSIQVFVRVRPLVTRPSDSVVTETATMAPPVAVRLGDAPNSLRVQSTSSSMSSSSSSAASNCVVTECAFDRVFMETASQDDVFAAVAPSIRATLDGFNATIFAYGQTGTGKTHTIFGSDSSVVDIAAIGEPLSVVKAAWGIIPRALALLFDDAQAQRESAGGSESISFQCSFLQIYNDRLFDLLTDRNRQRPLLVREQPTLDGGGTSVVIQGLSSERVATLDDALQLLRRGRTNRSVRETEMNASSSRSHAIVQLSITSERVLANSEMLVRRSRLNLVDLAGSEKWNTDIDMDDAHAFELKNINASLSALGNCIAALSEAGRTHIPFRNSTLTRVLQDALGGNAQACLIATISPAARSCDETLRTLQFADRARSVMQSVRVNETLSGVTELQVAKAQIAKLRERLESEQRRRHQTRVKEQDAAQRTFTETLQRKEREIEKLARDNAVFLRWRNEDVARIRELEARVKALDVGDETAGSSGDSVDGSVAIDDNNGVAHRRRRRDSPRGSRQHDRMHDHVQQPQQRQLSPAFLLPAKSATPVTSTAAPVKRVSSRRALPQTTTTNTSSNAIAATTATTTKRSDAHVATKPYRLVLERYALSSKKSHQRQPSPSPQPQIDDENQSNEPSSILGNSSTNSSNNTELLENAARADTHVYNGNQRLPDTSSQSSATTRQWDAIRLSAALKSESSPSLLLMRQPLASLEPERIPDATLQRSGSDCSTNAIATLPAKRAGGIATPSKLDAFMISSTSSLFTSSHPAAAAPTRTTVSANFATWCAANLVDTSRHAAQLHQTPSASQSLVATTNAAVGAAVRRTTEFESPIRASAVFASTGLAFVRSESSTGLSQSTAAAAATNKAGIDSSAPLLAPSAPPAVSSSSSIEPCGKHSLRGCVLCAAQGSRLLFASAHAPPAFVSMPTLQISVEPVVMSPTSVKIVACDVRAGSCDRHQLTNCFLCGSASSGTLTNASSLAQSSNGSSALTFLTGAAATGCERPSLRTQDNKCAAHMLANCVLCAGANAATTATATTAWTSSSSAIASAWQPAVDPTSPVTYQQQQLHFSSLARRHSVDYSASDSSNNTAATNVLSPTKDSTFMSPQQSAHDVYSLPSTLSASGAVPTTNTEMRYSAQASQSNLQQQQPAARASIKELAHESHRQSYNTLFREASDAAAYTLKRKV